MIVVVPLVSSVVSVPHLSLRDYTPDGGSRRLVLVTCVGHQGLRLPTNLEKVPKEGPGTWGDSGKRRQGQTERTWGDLPIQQGGVHDPHSVVTTSPHQPG